MSRKRACEQLSYDLLQMSVGECDAALSGTDEEEQGQHRRMQETVRKMCSCQLTPQQRTCVEQYYFHGKTIYEIASALQVCPSTVSRHLKKAVEKLRSILTCVTF